MYDYKSKERNRILNDKSQETARSKFYKEKTIELMNKGYPRSFARKIIKSALNKIGDIGKSQFANINLRKTRKERAKRLKVPFRPIYNGPTFKIEWSKNDKGEWIKECKESLL